MMSLETNPAGQPEGKTIHIEQDFKEKGLPITRENKSFEDRALSAKTRIQILLSRDAGKDLMTWIEENNEQNSKRVAEILAEEPELINLIEADQDRALLLFKQRLQEH